MKRLFIPGLIILFVLTLSACSSSKTPSADEQAKSQKISQQVENKKYTIEVDRAMPMRGRAINLSYGYDLKISNDSAYAYMPYFGVAQSAPYGGGEGGIKFATLMKEYTISPAKDGWDIRFKVDTKDYNYEFYLNIFKNGSSMVSVNSYQRDQISFTGNLKE